jgi:outer membrane protein assembly factor BamB
VLLRGHLVVPDDDGRVWVVKASPKFEVVHKHDLEEEVYASPAVADGRLYVRTEGRLYCFGEK